jgi:hydroxymethylpyrimidine/phosphomethylpyrimidine kinase
MPVVVLTIAGSDPSGGAGILADLETFQAFRVRGTAVVSTVTVQNSTGVRARFDVPAAIVADQIDAVLDDVAIAAAKTGLLPTAAVIDAVAGRLRARPVPHLVVDPVLAATSGDALVEPAAVEAYRTHLLPLATIVTPNLDEAAALAGRSVRTRADMRAAAQAILALGPRAVLVKGGHLAERACDVLATSDAMLELDGPRVDVGPARGTGCTLAAAIAASLAGGLAVADAVRRAKRYVTHAIAASARVGRGARLLDRSVSPD